MFTREVVLEQIERLCSSDPLHNSESLCKLLRYLAEQSLANPGAAIKEYQIATEVFHRAADFDPQLDSVIRVQAGRLRTKLSSYYSNGGGEDRIIVELPKGNYALAFRENPKKIAKVAEAPETKPVEAPVAAAPAVVHPAARPILVPVLAALLVVALGTIGVLLNARKGGPAVQVGSQAPLSYQLFWGPFVTGEDPWVVFSNAAFSGRPETGLRYYNAARDSKERVFDHYTGVGEVISVHNLDEVFSALHGHLRVKRGSLFSLDDVKGNNLIFLGSPAENLSLQDIPTTSHFVFQRPTAGTRAGDLAIATVNPGPGEPPLSMASPAGEPLTEDYALVGLKHGLPSSQLVLIVAGTTTMGTQGAVEYLCRQESLDELLKKLNVRKADEMKPFEALLHIRISRGVPVETSLVAVHQN